MINTDVINIHGKEGYIVENHQRVLMPWAIVRRNLEQAPILITLDHHMDTMGPFCVYADGDMDLADKLIEKVDYNSNACINSTIMKL